MITSFRHRPQPAAVDASKRFRLQRHVVSVRHGDDTVLLDVDRGEYYTLNEVAAVIWAQLGDRRTLPEIVTALRSHYGVPADTAERDTRQLIERLLTTSLIIPD